MTAKDYELIVAATVAARARIETTLTGDIRENQLRGIRRHAATIADALGKDNARFDAGRFLTACGYGATTMNPTDPALDLRPL